ncbi:hypothetical protein DEO23_14035 [Brachybacterium endophyticum]|uniref:HK97 gp10 family phage protein n=1 Tax=Brachybacterium endophyticum TaxID=2182385 RepID=A0A2U2RH67_9MICO|nr:DUF5403 family protein [Brachybacterium endophyticum]PWH05196.1 hypothetical protein DEO23_14035 [Brachybacterium endophyticum]
MATVNKNAGLLAARIAGEASEMDRAASKVRSAVTSEAAKHRETGDFQRSITSGRVPGEKGVTDRAVWAEDPAAWSIEFGHRTKNGTQVPGAFIFSNAARRF